VGFLIVWSEDAEQSNEAHTLGLLRLGHPARPPRYQEG